MSKKGLGPRAAERRRLERKKEEEARAREAQARQTAGEPRELDPMLDPLREYMLAKPGSVEEFPFGPQVMVFKVADKMFGLIAWEEVPVYVSLKCDPERSAELRERYSGITGAYHMNKQHWHSVAMDGSVDLDLAKQLMDESYDLIVATLPGKVRERLQSL